MLSQRLYLQEFEIRDALKGIRQQAIKQLTTNKRRRVRVSFSVRGLMDRRNNSVAHIRAEGGNADAVKQQLHSTSNTLDHGRRSAACPYEQFRARIWAVTELSALFDRSQPAHFLTITHPGHRCDSKGLAAFDVHKIHRMVQSLRLGLVNRGIPTAIFGMVEVSVSTINGVSVFEPHVHLIVSGPTWQQLHRARSVFPKSSTKIEAVVNLPGLLLYLTKFAATKRSAYIGETGKKGSRPNAMKSADRSAWLSFMARHGVADLFVHGGLRPGLKQRFLRADMGDLLDRLVRPVLPNGPRTLPNTLLRPRTA